MKQNRQDQGFPQYTGLFKRGIVLTQAEMNGDLPPVCICCGAAASVWRTKRYSEHRPAEFGSYGNGIIALTRHLFDWMRTLDSPKISFRVPFCSRHEHHWENLRLLFWSGMGLSAVILIGLVLIIASVGWGPGMFLLFFAVFLSIVFAFAFAQKLTFQMQAVSRNSIVLHHVHDDFISAVEAYRQQGKPLRSSGQHTAGDDLPMASVVDDSTRRGFSSKPAKSQNRSTGQVSPVNDFDDLVFTGSNLRKGKQARGEHCHWVADELTRGVAPERVESRLADQGNDPGYARQLVKAVLEELPRVLRDRYGQQFYAGIFALCGGLLAAVVAFALLQASFKAPLVIVTFLLAFGAIYLGALIFPMALWKLRQADRLAKTRRRWCEAEFPIPPGSEITSDEVHTALWTREQTRRLTFIGFGALAGVVGLILVCIGIVAVKSAGAGRNGEKNARDKEGELLEPAPGEEGPPPGGWTVLFRSSDPSIWNTDSPGANFAMPLRRAHSAIRFLRLTRKDTGEMLIVPIRRKQLASGDRPAPGAGHWWIGTAREAYGARHLGIAQVPASPESQEGLIALLLADGNSYSGSGFGWKTYKDDRQYYCWLGKSIPRTVFEIAVTADPLTEKEKQRCTGLDGEGTPRGWTVLFRANDPSLWNTFSPGEKFAMPIGRASRTIRYLRLRRMDTGESVIVAMTRDNLGREPRPAPEKSWSWNGSAKLEYGGRHLGIIDGLRLKWPELPRGDVSIMNDDFDGYRGFGFGHQMEVKSGQAYSWGGKTIPQTTFEIAVTAGALTDEETRLLLK